MPEYYCSIWGKPLAQLAGHELNICRNHGDSCSRCYCKRQMEPEEPAPVPELIPARPDPLESLLDSLYL